jgi:16S rRNA processing protein RimM
MKALPLSDMFASLVPATTVYLQADNKTCRCTIKSFRKMNRYLILSCDEIPDRNSASLFRGATVMIPTGPLPRTEGEYLREEIIGLAVVATDGDEIGSIVDIMETPAHDVYVVARRGREFLVPAVREFIAEISLDQKKIVVKKMHGMFD